MALAWNLSFGVEIKFWRGIQVSPTGSGKEDALGGVLGVRAGMLGVLVLGVRAAWLTCAT